MGDADAGDLTRGDPGEQHLPLRSLTRVEQQALVVPAQEIAVVIAAAGGRLTRRAEDHQLTIGHGNPPYAASAASSRRPKPVPTVPGSRPGHCRRTGGPAR